MKIQLITLAAMLLFAYIARANVGDSLISPDGKWTVYVVKGSGPKVGWGGDEVEPSELWQMDSHGGNRINRIGCAPQSLEASSTLEKLGQVDSQTVS